MSLSFLFFLTPDVSAAGFGGADVGVSVEIDANSSAYMLDLDVDSVRTENNGYRQVWAPFSVSMLFGSDGSVVDVDRASLAVLSGSKPFGASLVEANYAAGLVYYDKEGGFTDLVLGRGGVGFPVWGDWIQLKAGLDLRSRFYLAEDEGVSLLLGMGIPMLLRVETPSDRPNYAAVELGVRPGFKLVGDQNSTLQGQAKATVGYAWVQASDVEIKTGMTYEFSYDNAAVMDHFWSHRFGGKIEVRF